MPEVRDYDDSDKEVRVRDYGPPLEDQNRIIDESESETLTAEDVEDILGVCENEDGLGSPRKIDPEEVFDLYYNKRMSIQRIAEYYGYHSGKPIRKIFEKMEWDLRLPGEPKKKLDVEKVYKMYFELCMTKLEIAQYFGYKSAKPIDNIFEEQEWSVRRKQKDVDIEEIFRLYDKGLSFRAVSRLFDCSEATIRLIFKNHDKETRGRERDIDIQEAIRLYVDEGLSMAEVARRLECPSTTLRAKLLRNGIETRGGRKPRKKLDFDLVCELYFDKKWTMKRVAEFYGFKSGVPIQQFFRTHRLEPRFQPILTNEQREEALKEYYEGHRDRIRELRDAIFGTECQICGGKKKIIHKKDGEPHHPRLLWTYDTLRSLNPEEWVAVCKPCHLVVHNYMKRGLDWDTLFPHLKKALRGLSQDDS